MNGTKDIEETRMAEGKPKRTRKTDPDRVLWREVSKTKNAWAHIRTSIKGAKDTARCIVCKTEIDLAPKVKGVAQSPNIRTSNLRRLARTHYYKHKLWQPSQEPITPTVAEY